MSLVNTRMQSLRAAYPSNLDKNEVRLSKYSAWDFFQADTKNPTTILPETTRSIIKNSFGNTVTIPVLDAEDVTIGNVRSCTIADDENTSNLYTLTFATYAFGFTMTPAYFKNNDIAYQADWDRKLLKYIQKFAAVLDTASIAVLETYKNQVTTGLTDYYPFTGGALQITQAQKNDFYNNLEAIMATMDFYGKTNIIGSISSMPLVNRLKNQGASNSSNEEFQLGGYEWWLTNRIANAGGIQSTGYAIQDGSVAVENRNDPDAMMKSTALGGGREWDEVQVPVVNLKMGSYYTEDCSDRSNLDASATGLTRSKLEGYEWSTDICFVTAYNSSIGTKYNPIQKFQISAS